MARPLAFERTQALDKALVLFWDKGYQASSLADLLTVMDISRSSFYAAFEDKRSLFRECLDLFAEHTLEILHKARATRPPLDALQDFFQRSFNGGRSARAPRKHWGCLLVNTVLEMAGVDEDLVAHASRHLGRVQRVFQSCLQDAGAAPSRAEELAAMLMLVNEGIRVSSRRRLPDAQHLQLITTTFRLIRSTIQ